MRILLIEDNRGAAYTMSYTMSQGLISSGFDVEHTNLDEGYDLAATYDYDLILIESDRADIEVLRRLRSSKINTPIIMITAMSKVEIQVQCFNLGADDYLLKPFHRDILIARCQAVIRRARSLADNIISFGDFSLNLSAQRLSCDGEYVHLTDHEYRLLETLVLAAGRTMSKDALLNAIYGGMDGPESKIIDVFICKVRTKMAKASNGKVHIETIWGRGYVFRYDALEPFEKKGVVDSTSLRPPSSRLRLLKYLFAQDKSMSSADLRLALDMDSSSFYSAINDLRIRGYAETRSGMIRGTSRHHITDAGRAHIITLNEKVLSDETC